MSKIEWCDVTWNPTRGCSMAKGSEKGGCLNCYAARMASRGFSWGKGLARMTASGPRWTGHVSLIPEKLDEPLRWRPRRERCDLCMGTGQVCPRCLGKGYTTRPLRVFVDSMSDLFHEELTDYDIAEVWARMAAADWHTFQVLTKRAGRLKCPYCGVDKRDCWCHDWDDLRGDKE